MGKNHPNVDDYVVSRVRAIESLLLEKGLLAPDAVDRVVRRYETSTGPMIGARAVARAWRDQAYRGRLLGEPMQSSLASRRTGVRRLPVSSAAPPAPIFWSRAAELRSASTTSCRRRYARRGWRSISGGSRCGPASR